MSRQGNTCNQCGARLQTKHPKKAGYIPARIYARRRSTQCRQCHQTEKRDRRTRSEKNKGTSRRERMGPLTLLEAISSADALLFVNDVWNFETGFALQSRLRFDGPIYIAVNKVDLLPSRISFAGVRRWVAQRFAKTHLQIADIRLISAARGTGVRALRRKLERHIPRQGRLVVYGTTQVGKSSLVRHWLVGKQHIKRAAAPDDNVMYYTSSRNAFEIVDIPGHTDEQYVSNTFCSTCARRFEPNRRLKPQPIQVRSGHAIVLGHVATIHATDLIGKSTVFSTYNAHGLPRRVVKTKRAVNYLQKSAQNGHEPFCSACQTKLQTVGWEDVMLDVKENEDIVIPGVGWVSPHHGPLRVTVTLPAGYEVFVRPRLLGRKGRRLLRHS